MKLGKLTIVVLTQFILMGCCENALAQTDKRTPQQLREQLRRTQQAQRDVEAERDRLAQELVILQARQTAEAGVLARIKKVGTVEAQQARAAWLEQQNLAGQLRTQLAQRQQELADERKLRQDDQHNFAQKLLATQREATERAQANAALTQMLEQRSKALALAQSKNQQLYAAGLATIEQYRNKTAGDAVAQIEPLFGLREIELENIAEGLRNDLDAARVVAR